MEVCRACFARDKIMLPLSETFINGYNLLTNLNIKPSDGMPQCACKTCTSAVNFFMDFREQCIDSESRLQQQLLENMKCEPEEFESDQDSLHLTPEKINDQPPKSDGLLKKSRGRPKKKVAASETPKQKSVRHRKNKTNTPEVQKSVSRSFENSNTEELSLSRFDHNGDLDFIKEEFNYEYIEILDANLDLDSGLDVLAFEPHTTSDSLPANVHKPPVKNQSKPKESKTTKYPVVTKMDFPCGLCKKVFATRQLASGHLEEHKNDAQCETCQETFSGWQELLAHRIKHVPKEYHQCHMCPKRLNSVETLEYHYLSTHSNKNLQDIKLQCKFCIKSFATPRKLKNHIGLVHVRKEYICDHCKKTCGSRNGIKIHLRQHSEVKKYVCDTCGDRFRQSTSLQSHIWRRHTPTRVYCPCCHRVYPHEDELQKHVCPQVEKICPVCGKVFPRADRLNNHLLTHTDVRKYKCEHCPSAFKTRASFEAHSNRHGGLRPHACPHCPKRFMSADLLIRHKRIHTGVRPYVCKRCSKAFNSSYNLKFHMRVHGEYLVAHRDKPSHDTDHAQP